mgnify:FL=1
MAVLRVSFFITRSAKRMRYDENRRQELRSYKELLIRKYDKKVKKLNNFVLFRPKLRIQVFGS